MRNRLFRKERPVGGYARNRNKQRARLHLSGIMRDLQDLNLFYGHARTHIHTRQQRRQTPPHRVFQFCHTLSLFALFRKMQSLLLCFR